MIVHDVVPQASVPLADALAPDQDVGPPIPELPDPPPELEPEQPLPEPAAGLSGEPLSIDPVEAVSDTSQAAQAAAPPSDDEAPSAPATPSEPPQVKPRRQTGLPSVQDAICQALADNGGVQSQKILNWTVEGSAAERRSAMALLVEAKYIIINRSAIDVLDEVCLTAAGYQLVGQTPPPGYLPAGVSDKSVVIKHGDIKAAAAAIMDEVSRRNGRTGREFSVRLLAAKIHRPAAVVMVALDHLEHTGQLTSQFDDRGLVSLQTVVKPPAPDQPADQGAPEPESLAAVTKLELSRARVIIGYLGGLSKPPQHDALVAWAAGQFGVTLMSVMQLLKRLDKRGYISRERSGNSYGQVTVLEAGQALEGRVIPTGVPPAPAPQPVKPAGPTPAARKPPRQLSADELDWDRAAARGEDPRQPPARQAAPPSATKTGMPSADQVAAALLRGATRAINEREQDQRRIAALEAQVRALQHELATKTASNNAAMREENSRLQAALNDSRDECGRLIRANAQLVGRSSTEPK